MSSDAVAKYREMLARSLIELHSRWAPHPAQAQIGAALLTRGHTDIFAVCGRNFGKTELVAYLLWRYARTFPGSENYYFSPYMKQSREILWETNRVQGFGPKSWLDGNPNNTEMRIRFKNKSFIKLDGSDNVEAYRGVKPRGLTIFDEFKDFRPEFFEAYDPNRAAFGSPLLIIGTPPEFEGQFISLFDAWSKDKDKATFRFPTSCNPHLDREWLAKKKSELYARAEGDVWEREYEARFVKGGAKRIFPMLAPTMVKPHDQVMASILRERRRMEWFVWADPAGASTFAVLFVGINPYTKHVYFLDEIYEQRQEEMTVGKIGRRIIEMTKDLEPDHEWRHGYDEAETWFANEMLEHFDLSFEPTSKNKNDKTTGLALLKDAMLANKVTFSSRCRKLYWEMDNYRKDDNGRIMKKDDHLIDCARYVLGASYYSLNESEYKTPEMDEMWRGARIEDDFPGFRETGEPEDEWETYEDFEMGW
jgi:hypothetical protein